MSPVIQPLAQLCLCQRLLVAKRLGLVLSLVLAASLAVAQPGQDSREDRVLIRSLLAKVLRNPVGASAEAVQRRLMPDNSTVTVKGEFVRGRGVRITLIEPVTYQGMVVVDNLVEYKIFHPDTRKLEIRTSPLRFRQPIEDRLRLIDQNYDLRLLDPVRIAGRLAQVVELRAKGKEIPDRVLSIDAKEDFLLRYEVTSKSGTRRLIDTISVSFRPRNPEAVLNLDVPSDTKEERAWGPTVVTDDRSAASAIGFEPRGATNLPHGFVLTARHLVGFESNPALGLRLTDGMASVTVYQYLMSRYRRNLVFGPALATDSQGVAYSSLGDVPRSVLRDLAQSFVPRALNQDQEPRWDSYPLVALSGL